MPLRGVNRLRRLTAVALAQRPTYREVWIDVGAHRGETSLLAAAAAPRRRIVYAFEPNLALAATLMGRMRNYVVLPIAVDEADGAATFRINSNDLTSSLLPFDEERLARWKGAEGVHTVRQVKVPTMRLDTFLEGCAIQTVSHLKVDAQGADLSVLKSAGSRLRDIERITVETAVGDHRQYIGQPGRADLTEFMDAGGFRLARSETQSQGQEQNLTYVREA
jgi:FkbM family methyltransferase